MSDLHITLLTDGPADRVLLHHLRWLLRQYLSPSISPQFQWADLRPLREKPRGLADRLKQALRLYPCDLLFVHRDAEREEPHLRCEEIQKAVGALASPPPLVSVVPVRMTEAWLLFDEKAIRFAAGNPNGQSPLPVPVARPEEIADPKSLLHQALRSASGLAGRRLKKFSLPRAVQQVGDYVDDFSALRQVPAFRRLERGLETTLRSAGWHREAG